MHRRLPAVAGATLALTMLATPALAHTTANPSTTAAGAYAIIDMRVPHGCDGAATVALDVQIPAGVVSVKPEQVAGWTASVEIGEYDEAVEIHGEEITEGVVGVTWTADGGVGLPDAQFRDFGLSVKLPDLAGETLYLPAVQTCDDGSEAAWIEIPASEGDELDMPAPAITLTEAAAGHGHGDATDEADDAAEDEEAAAGETSGDTAELSVVEAAADDTGTDPLVLVALVLGGLGLLAGGAGFAAARRR